MRKNHLLFIPDGNRRFLQKNQPEICDIYNTISILEFGLDKLYDSIKYIYNNYYDYIDEISCLLLSPENIQRPNIIHCIDNYCSILVNKIKQNDENMFVVNIFGDLTTFSDKTQLELNSLKENNNKIYNDKPKINVNLFINYNWELDLINHKNYNSWQKNSEIGKIKPFDFMIRTGGTKRISGFLSLKFSYTEMYFLDNLWPELKNSQIDHCINDFKQRACKYGL